MGRREQKRLVSETGGVTCQRKGDCHCLPGARADEERQTSPRALEIKGQRQADRQTNRYSPSGNRCTRTVNGTSFRHKILKRGNVKEIKSGRTEHEKKTPM